MINLKAIIFLPLLVMVAVCAPLIVLFFAKNKLREKESESEIGETGEEEKRISENGAVGIFEKKVEPKNLTLTGGISMAIGFLLFAANVCLRINIPLFEIVLPFLIFGVTFLLFGLISRFGSSLKSNSSQNF